MYRKTFWLRFTSSVKTL